MKKNTGNVLVITLALIAVLGICTSIFLFWQNRQLQSKPAAQPTETTPVATSPASFQVPTQTQTQDQTANWKTYTNTHYYFSFKYPTNMFVEEIDMYPNTPTPPDTDKFVVVVKSNQVQVTSFVGLFTVQILNMNHAAELTASSGYTTQQINLTGVAGIKGVRTKEVPGISQLDTVLSFYHNNVSYEITYPNTDDHGSHEQLFDQILSTFKFL